jgi:hypothetical protein
MKTLIISIALVFCVTAAFAGSENSAVVLKGDDHPYGCFTSQLPGTPLITQDQIHTVATKSGNTKLVCHFDIPEGYAPAKVVQSYGFGCGIYLPTVSVATTDTFFTANPGGKALMECTVKALP